MTDPIFRLPVDHHDETDLLGAPTLPAHLIAHHEWTAERTLGMSEQERVNLHNRDHRRVGQRRFFVRIERHYDDEFVVWADDEDHARTEAWLLSGGVNDRHHWNVRDRVVQVEPAEEVGTPSPPRLLEWQR